MPNDSPLKEASPTSLDELFARIDHHIATRKLDSPGAQLDLEAVVAAYRAQREAWALAEAAGAKRAPKKATGGKEQAQTLADLGLE